MFVESVLMSYETLTMPVSTWEYDSKVSKRRERLPIAAGILAAPGSDHGLLTFAAHFLEESGLPVAVRPGRGLFAPDPNETSRNANSSS